MKLSGGEKLILIMLSEIHEKLKIEDGIDPQFVRDMIYDECTWAIAWKYPGIVGSSEDETPPIVHEVLDILEMWELLEYSYKELKPADKAKVKADAKPSRQDVRFKGFDGNNETEYMGIAGVLTNHLDRYTIFKGRDLNSHLPSLQNYRQMLEVFSPIRNAHSLGMLNAEQIIQVLNA